MQKRKCKYQRQSVIFPVYQIHVMIFHPATREYSLVVMPVYLRKTWLK